MEVVVQNGFKSYSNGPPVLKGLNLNIKSGTIYGLLGSSGCGKTTLLSCIVGLKKLDSGEIVVHGSTPGKKGSNIPGVGVGFMPQSMSSLNISLTIEQTFWFFGRVIGMSEKRIKERIEFLSNFLELSDLSKTIHNLSGGQFRCVSLGVAMIHQPPLLILDEPTVGMDPLLRQKIWNHLLDLQDEKITILLTTHYSEEAKCCGTIGIMRRGRLIAEESPAKLLAQTNYPVLETAIVQLCRRDEEDPNSFNNFNKLAQNLPKIHYAEQTKQTKSSIIIYNMHIIFAMLYRSFTIYKMQPILLVAQIVIPLLNIVLFGYILGIEPSGMKLNFVSNQWNSLQTQKEVIQYCAQYDEMTNGTCLPGGIGPFCSFFNQFKENEIIWTSKAEEQDALISVKNGDSIGYLSFPQNFSQHLVDRLLFRAYSDNVTIDGSTISVKMDMTNALNKMWIFQKLMNTYSAFISDLAKECDQNIRTLPVKYNSIYGDKNGATWSQFMQPFFIVLVMYMLSSNVSGMTQILGKKWGITERLTVVGIKFGHIMISTLIFESCIILVQIGILFPLLVYIYGMVVQGSWFIAVLIVYLSSIGGVAFGLLLTTILNNEVEFLILNLFLNFLNIFSSGGFWPIESINPWYRLFCQMMPIALPIDSLRSIALRGWGLEYFKVWRGLAIPVFYTILSMLLGNWFHNRK